MAKGNTQQQSTDSGINVEAQLWATTDKMRRHMDTIWKLARMNLAIRDSSLSASNGERVGVRCRILRNADSFRTDLHPDLKADFVQSGRTSSTRRST